MCKDCGCSAAKHSVFARPKAEALRKTSALALSLQESPPTRRISVEESIFEKNQNAGARNREDFRKRGLTVFNVMSSPGSGKTTLLARVLPDLARTYRLAVVVGDQETSIDADRLEKAGLKSLQINTHSACHLDASRVANAIGDLPVQDLDWIVIENVGNLVCPAVFDLGETLKIALLSLPEGEEKPLKYPVLFHDADLIVLTKSDLLPYLDYDLTLVSGNLRKMNTHASIVLCSAKTGEGMAELKDLLEGLVRQKESKNVSGDTRANS